MRFLIYLSFMGGTTPPYVPLQSFIGTPLVHLLLMCGDLAWEPVLSEAFPKPLPEFMLHYLRETLSNLK